MKTDPTEKGGGARGVGSQGAGAPVAGSQDAVVSNTAPAAGSQDAVVPNAGAPGAGSPADRSRGVGSQDAVVPNAGSPAAGVTAAAAPAANAADLATGRRPKLEALLLYLLQSLYAAEQEVPAMADQIRARTSSALLQSEMHACRIQALNQITHLQAAFTALRIQPQPQPQRSATVEILIQRIRKLAENTPMRATECALILCMQQFLHQQMANQLAAAKMARVLGNEALAWQLEQAAGQARSTDHHLELIAAVRS